MEADLDQILNICNPMAAWAFISSISHTHYIWSPSLLQDRGREERESFSIIKAPELCQNAGNHAVIGKKR